MFNLWDVFISINFWVVYASFVFNFWDVGFLFLSVMLKKGEEDEKRKEKIMCFMVSYLYYLCCWWL